MKTHSQISFARLESIDGTYPSGNATQTQKISQQSDNKNNSDSPNDFQKPLKQPISVCPTTGTVQKEQIPVKNQLDNPFEEELGFLIKNAKYKWRFIDRPIRFPQNKDIDCDACRGGDHKKPKPLLMKNLEPRCGHEIHQSCRSRFARAVWEFDGYFDGYLMKDCPVCYWESKTRSVLSPSDKKSLNSRKTTSGTNA